MKTVLATTLFLLATFAQGQGIYRCGNTFTQQPCGADAKVIQAAPVRAAAVKELPDNPPADSVIEANKLACVAAVRGAMKDPESARITPAKRSGPSVDYFNGERVNVVSYWVNANGKNSYGGYTGEKLHICSFDPDEKRIIRTTEIGPAVR